MEIEQTAISLDLNQSSNHRVKIGKSKVNVRIIQQNRNEAKVVDLLKLRLGYLREKEESVRNYYKRLRRTVERTFESKPRGIQSKPCLCNSEGQTVVRNNLDV